MKGQKLIAIYNPKDEEDWFLFETEEGRYTIRVGCFKKTDETREPDLKIDVGFSPAKIVKIITNEFNTYFELENGSCILHVESYVTGSGDMYFEVRFWDKHQFDAEKREWYDSDPDLKELSSIE